MNLEYRTFLDIDIRAADDDTPSVILQCIKPGVVDDYGSLWKPNAFDAALAKRMPVLCWAHDWRDPLGPAVSFELTRTGPKVKFHFSDFDAVPQAKRAHAQVLDGTIRDCSVGFSNTQRRDPTAAEEQKYPGIREVIEQADLDEVSLVLRGAVPGARVLAVRSARIGGGTVDMEAVLEIARKKAAGELSDAEAQAAIQLLSTVEGAPPPVNDPAAEAAALAAAAEADAAEAALALDVDIMLAGLDA